MPSRFQKAPGFLWETGPTLHRECEKTLEETVSGGVKWDMRRTGFSFIEVILALLLLSAFFGTGYKAWQSFTHKKAENLSKRLVLQMEARKAFLNLTRELQQGMEVVSPKPGTTLPYLVYKDYVNNLRVVFLDEDPVRSREERRTIYRAISAFRDPSSPTAAAPVTLMEHVVRLNFTAYSPGGVLVSARLHSGNGDYSLVNFIRLQNVSAEEEP